MSFINFIEELHLLCRKEEVYQLATSLNKKLCEAFPEADFHTAYQLEESEDIFELQKELPATEVSEQQNYTVYVPFRLYLQQGTEDALDLISDRVFSVIQSLRITVPYFSFLDIANPDSDQ